MIIKRDIISTVFVNHNFSFLNFNTLPLYLKGNSKNVDDLFLFVNYNLFITFFFSKGSINIQERRKNYLYSIHFLLKETKKTIMISPHNLFINLYCKHLNVYIYQNIKC